MIQRSLFDPTSLLSRRVAALSGNQYHIEHVLRALDTDTIYTGPHYCIRLFAPDNETSGAASMAVRLADQVKHPGLVKILDYGQIGDRFFYVSEFPNSTTLKHLIGSGCLPAQRAAQFALPIYKTLTHVDRLKLTYTDYLGASYVFPYNQNGQIEVTMMPPDAVKVGPASYLHKLGILMFYMTEGCYPRIIVTEVNEGNLTFELLSKMPKCDCPEYESLTRQLIEHGANETLADEDIKTDLSHIIDEGSPIVRMAATDKPRFPTRAASTKGVIREISSKILRR